MKIDKNVYGTRQKVEKSRPDCIMIMTEGQTQRRQKLDKCRQKEEKRQTKNRQKQTKSRQKVDKKQTKSRQKVDKKQTKVKVVKTCQNFSKNFKTWSNQVKKSFW